MNLIHFYSLTFQAATPFFGKGDVVRNAADALTIGESADCDVRFPQSDTTRPPVYYATILRNRDGKSWRIVKRTDDVEVTIGGAGGFEYAAHLHDGDVLQFAGQRATIKFRTHHNDAGYGAANALIQRKGQERTMRLAYGAFAAIVAMLIGLGCYVYSQRPQSITPAEMEPYEQSVYLLKVDSVHWVEVTHGTERILGTKTFDGETAPFGTAFLTDDSCLVTARHCVEYWLGDSIDFGMSIDKLPTDDIRRMVAVATTFNLEHADSTDTTHVLRTFCSVYARDNTSGEPVFRFTSTDDSVHIDRTRDGIVTLDDFSTRYYWRTITPYFNRRDMELGDALWVDVSRAGNIARADSAFVARMERGSPLAFWGFPVNDTDNIMLMAEHGEVKIPPCAPINDEPNPFHNLIHSGAIGHGYSGGPVLVRDGKRLVAVAVVSNADGKNNDLKRSVPITMIRAKNKH